MKTHYGEKCNEGDYEYPAWTCTTACGYDGETVMENTTEDWAEVDCKKCLKVKDNVIASKKSDEEAIVRQMGEFVDFTAKEKE